MPDKAEINVSHLPLTRLAATGLDRVTIQRERVIEDTAKYAGSDMLCYRAPAPVEPGGAPARRPGSRCSTGRRNAMARGLSLPRASTFVAQPADALARLRDAVAAHGDLALAALYNLTHISGSLVIALAVAEGHLPADKAFAAAQLDELYQIERWGEDPTSTLRHDEHQARHRGRRALPRAAGKTQRLKG